MKVLVTFALENEFAPWRNRRKFWPGKWGEAEVYFAKIGAVDLGVLLTGAGPKQARSQASKIFRSENDPMHFCVSSGLAGALRPDYRVGQVLAARSVCVEEALEGDSDTVVAGSEALLSFAAECGASPVDRFYSTGRVVATANEKKALSARADAVEMESFEILRQAQMSGIPAVAIRAISDSAEQNMPLDMNEVFTNEGQVSIPRVLGQVALHPGSIPGLVGLAQQSKLAAGALCEFLDRYVTKLGETAAAIGSQSSAAGQ